MLSNKPDALGYPRRAARWTNPMEAGAGVCANALVPGDPASETGGRAQYDRATRTRAHG
ncbi:hypothetical protein ABIA38_008786 [Embleya sp. AB8]